MILAEKITYLRKQKDWSQEELADQMEISRQSVSKWESGTSIPELDKIIKMSSIFSVSADFLLKDEYDISAISEAGQQKELPAQNQQDTIGEEELTEGKIRVLTLEEANIYLETVRQNSYPIAIGVLICILSPICLLLMGGWSEYGPVAITEDMASGLGIVILLVMVAGAVALFLISGMKLERYEYLEKEVIRLQYGVKGIVEKHREAFLKQYQKNQVAGVILCILSLLPLLFTMGLGAPDIWLIYSICVLLTVVSVGVFLLVRTGCIWESFQKLLQEGDYSAEKKRANRRLGPLSAAYWCLVTAVYLGVNFYHDSHSNHGIWERTWAIWPVAGLLFVVLLCILHAVERRREGDTGLR